MTGPLLIPVDVQLEKDAERQTRKAEKKAQKAAEKDAERAAKAAEREACAHMLRASSSCGHCSVAVSLLPAALSQARTPAQLDVRNFLVGCCTVDSC